MMQVPDWGSGLPGVTEYVERVDYWDNFGVEGKAELEPFVVALMTCQPGWVQWLMKLRNAIMSLLPGEYVKKIEDDSSRYFIPGEPVGPFTVISSEENSWWLAGIKDRHLNAALAVRRIEGPRQARFEALTLVEFNNRFGRFYFSVIKPFHILIVRSLLRIAIKSCSKS